MKKATVIGLLCLVFLQFLQTASSKGRVIIGPFVFDLLSFSTYRSGRLKSSLGEVYWLGDGKGRRKL